jgi:hypothetical protein
MNLESFYFSGDVNGQRETYRNIFSETVQCRDRIWGRTFLLLSKLGPSITAVMSCLLSVLQVEPASAS